MKLVSFIMPSRSTPYQQLRRAVKSIYESSNGNAEDLEVLLRVDDDDSASIYTAKELQREYGCQPVVGPRGSGYNNMGVFVQDLVNIADSKWCFLFDDDSYIEGDWHEQLSKVRCDPVRGPAANAENYVLGESWYKNGPHGGAVGLIIPTGLAKTIRHENPVDQQWLGHILALGWSIHQLAGVSYHHCGRRR